MRRHLFVVAFALLFGATVWQAHAGDGDVKKQIANLKAKSAETRQAAADALGKLGPKAPAPAIDALVAALGDENVAVRRAAGSALLAIGDPALKPLAVSLTSFNRVAQLMSLTVLARFGPDALPVVEELTEALKDPDLDVRIHAARALEAVGPRAKAAVPTLVKVSRDTSNIGALVRPGLANSVCEAALLAIKAIDPSALQQASKNALPGLLQAFKSQDPSTRKSALAAVGLLGPYGTDAIDDLRLLLLQETAAYYTLQELGPEGHKVLWSLARSEQTDLNDRVFIIRMFWRSREHASKVTIDSLRALLKNKVPGFRRMAVDVLGTFGSAAKAAIPDLVAALEDEGIMDVQDPFWKQENAVEFYPAARALARIGDDSLPALIGALASDKAIVRLQATKALSTMGRKAKKAIPELRKGLNDKAGSVVMESSCALLRAGDAPAEPLQQIERKLKLGSTEDRWEALEIIARVGPRAKKLTPQVMALLASAPDLTEATLFTLRKLGPAAKDAAPLAAKLLQHSDAGVRLQALALLDSLGPDAKLVVPELAAALKDKNADFRTKVAEALGRIGPDAKAALPALIGNFKVAEIAELKVIIDTLGNIGPDAKPVAPLLNQLLEHDNPMIRFASARSLGDMGPGAKDALPTLQKMLDDEEPSVRAVVAYALAQITDKAEPHVDFLMKLYKTRALDAIGESGRTDAILALARMGPAAKKAVPVLMDAARSAAPDVAYQAILALGQYGPDSKEALPLLMELLRHENASFREAAAQSLGSIGPAAKAAVARLTEMVNEDEEAVADAAGEALRAIGGKR